MPGATRSENRYFSPKRRTERGLQPGVARNERRPTLGLPLELVDTRRDGRVPCEREGFHELEGALVLRYVRTGELEPPARQRGEARGPRFDQEEERRRPSLGRAAEQLLPVEEAAELIVAHQRVSCAAMSRYRPVRG